jgi:hypothetical protein
VQQLLLISQSSHEVTVLTCAEVLLYYVFVANGRSILSIEDRLDDERHPLPLTAADAVATNGVNPWNWRDTSTNGTSLHMLKTK